jgi:hypothetical protein
MPLHDVEWGAGGRPDQRAFLARWAGCVADSLNPQFAGGRQSLAAEPVLATRAEAVGVVPAFDPDAPPPFVAPARFVDRVEVVVRPGDAGRAGAAVLFVCPDHKADSDAALAFAVRAASFLAAGAAIVIVDTVAGPPSWATHLHSLAPVYPIARRPRGADRPVLVVQPVARDGVEGFAVWHHTISAGSTLPTVLLGIPGGTQLRLDLEATYTAAYGPNHTP